MKVNEIKVEIVKSLFETNDEALLVQVKEILNFPKTDFWHSLTDEQKESVFEARQELAEGKGIAHEEVKAEYSKWLTK